MTNECCLDLAIKCKPWNKSQRIDALLSIIALSQIIIGAIQGTFIAIGMPEEMASEYRVYFSAFMILIAVPFLLKRNVKLVVIIYLVALFIYWIHSLFFPRTIEYWINEGFRFTFPISIPTLLSVISIKDKSILFYHLKITAVFTGILCLIYGGAVFLGFFSLGDSYDYNQGYGYMLLFPIIVLFYHRKWYSLFFSCILFLLLLFYGGRGPLLSVALFFFYYLVSQKKFLQLAVILSLIIIAIPILASTVQSFGISSKVLEYMVEGELSNDL